MRSAVSYFFLLLTLNVVLFHPMNETDWMEHAAFSDPINSLAELVVEVCLGIPDTQMGDERDAETDHFSGFQVIPSFGNSSLLLDRANVALASTGFSCGSSSNPTRISVTVISPPPELLA